MSSLASTYPIVVDMLRWPRIFINTLILAPRLLSEVANVLLPLWLLAPSMPAARYMFKKC
jgi:hypothetical protein